MATRAKATRAKAAPRSRAQRGTAKGKANEHRRTVEDSNARVINGMKELVYAQIGLYGQIYDELDARLAKLRADTPKRWQKLVTRGEKMQRDVEKAQAELVKSLEKSRGDLQKRLDRTQARLRRKLEDLRRD